MRLLRVELTRFFSRRAIVLLILAAALLTALVAGTTLWNTRPVSAHDMAQARAQVQEALASPDYQRELSNCEKNPTDYFGPGADASDCQDSLAPQPQNYLNRGVLSLDQERTSSGLAVIVLVTALMILAGTTFAGADWGSASMRNQLLFEPRRVRVWAVKAVAVLLGCLVVAAVVVGVFWLVLSSVAHSRGLTSDPGTSAALWWTALRGTLLAGVAGLGGYALTMLMRNTVATVAVLFAYAAGGEALLALLPLDRPSRFSPATNVFAWVRDGVKVFDPSVVCGPGQPCEEAYQVSLAHGAAYLLVLLVLALLLSAISFRRRDIP
jgi:hypothetical protein